VAAESLHLLSQTMSLFGQTGQQLSSGQGRFSTGQTATQLQHTVPAHSLCIQSLHTVSAYSLCTQSQAHQKRLPVASAGPLLARRLPLAASSYLARRPQRLPVGCQRPLSACRPSQSWRTVSPSRQTHTELGRLHAKQSGAHRWLAPAAMDPVGACVWCWPVVDGGALTPVELGHQMLDVKGDTRSRSTGNFSETGQSVKQ